MDTTRIRLTAEEYQECLRRARLLWPNGTKQCTHCHDWLPLESFGGRRNRPTAPLQAFCKKCQSSSSHKKTKTKDKAATALLAVSESPIIPVSRLNSLPNGEATESIDLGIVTWPRPAIEIAKSVNELATLGSETLACGIVMVYYGMATILHPEGNGKEDNREFDFTATDPVRGETYYIDVTTSEKEFRSKSSAIRGRRQGRATNAMLVMLNPGLQFKIIPPLPEFGWSK